MSQVTITTGSRLHFGPLSYHPEQGRHFGGVGVMIDDPGVALTFGLAEVDSVRGDEASAERVRQFVVRYRENCPNDRQPPKCAVQLNRAIPAHNGLGSGTQIGLAVAKGLAMLAGEESLPVDELARRVGRGRRSAVGIHGFESGGLIVDAGQYRPGELGDLACRVALPESWRVLLITPRANESGLSGTSEEQAFQSLGSMDESITRRLCAIVLTELLPAANAGQFDLFSRSLYEYGRLVGQFFAPVQGGLFGHPQADEVIGCLRNEGIHGVGQTSWGPTVFAFVENDAALESSTQIVRSVTDIDIQTTSVRNIGAQIDSDLR